MPCSPLATSLSKSRRRPSLRLSPPRIAATLDLSKPSEHAAHDLVRRFTAGRWPTWRLLAMSRRGDVLLAAVEWRRCGAGKPYAVVNVSLTETALRWSSCATADAARQGLRDGATNTEPTAKA